MLFFEFFDDPLREKLWDFQEDCLRFFRALEQKLQNFRRLCFHRSDDEQIAKEVCQVANGGRSS
jgi:hypothetical protein